MHVLVTGGTGALGRQVVKRVLDTGHRARILSRRQAEGTARDWVQGDLVTGAGLELAVKNVDAIVHAASNASAPRKYQATDVLGTPACDGARGRCPPRRVHLDRRYGGRRLSVLPKQAGGGGGDAREYRPLVDPARHAVPHSHGHFS